MNIISKRQLKLVRLYRLIIFCLCCFNVAGLSQAFAQRSRGARPVTPDRRAVVFGGNCEERNATNNFNAPMTQMAGVLRSRGWQIHPFFDGDRSRCTNCSQEGEGSTWRLDSLAQASGRTPSEVRRASREELYDELDRLARDPTLGAQTQLLLSFHTHGNTNDGHLDLCLSDGSRLRSDDPEFTRRLKAVRGRGAQLGFVISACHSAAAVADLRPFGCVLTSGLAHQSVWIDGFETLLARALQATPEQRQGIDLNGDNHLSMEEIFLHELVNSRDSGQPQLSSMPESIEIEAAQLPMFPLELAQLSNANACRREPATDSYEALARIGFSAAISVDLVRMMTAFQGDRAIGASVMAIPTLAEVQRLHEDLAAKARRYAALVRGERDLRNEMEGSQLRVPVSFVPSAEFAPWNDLLSQAARETVSLPVSYLVPYTNQFPPERILSYHLLAMALGRITEPQLAAQFQAAMPTLERQLASRIRVPRSEELLRIQSSAVGARAQQLAQSIVKAQSEQGTAWSQYSAAMEQLDRVSRNLRFAAFLRNRRDPAMSHSQPIRDCALFRFD